MEVEVERAHLLADPRDLLEEIRYSWLLQPSTVSELVSSDTISTSTSMYTNQCKLMYARTDTDLVKRDHICKHICKHLPANFDLV